MPERKKKVLINTNFCKLFTGFGKNAKNLLKFLHKTGKYELIEYAAQTPINHPDLNLLPWKAHGTLPISPHEVHMLNSDPAKAQRASYGEYYSEEVIKKYKPDVALYIEDAWANDFQTNKSFWGKIPCVLWVTHDSVPLISSDTAKKTPYYWVWSDFARKEFHKKGDEFKHVKTQYPLVDLKNFYDLGPQKKAEIRARFNIPQDTFIIGDVFRNQLRKLSVTNGMEGFAMFKKQNPGVKSILLLITNFAEGWDIMRLANQYGVDPKDIWTAYVSSESPNYVIHPFVGNEQTCPFSGKEKAMRTVSVSKGVSEEQLNEIYNIMDVFSHPATSGACELPCVEAAAAGKIILTSDYSYGEDIIELNEGAICLDWAKYTEFGTHFIKSSPYPSGIAKAFNKVYLMSPQKRAELGLKSSNWARKNYDLEVNGKKVEEFLDSLPLANWDDIKLETERKNPDFPFPEGLSDAEFIITLYREILKMNEGPDSSGFKHWDGQIKNGMSRRSIYDYFVNVAREENIKNTPVDFNSLIDRKRENKRALFLIKESIGDIILCTSLFKSFHERYPNTDLYVMTEPKYFEILEGNERIFKLVPYIQQFENEMFAIGAGQPKENCYFDYYFHPAIHTQRHLSYLSYSNLLETYSRSSGLHVSEIEISESYYPNIEGPYITIQNGSGQQSKNYDYINEVLDIIYPILKHNNIRIIQLGGKDDPPVKYCEHFQGKTTIRQAYHLLRLGIMHIGPDSWQTHVAGFLGKPLVAMYGSTSAKVHGPIWRNPKQTFLIESHRNGRVPSYSQEYPKSINKIPPEEIINSILTIFNAERKIDRKSVFIGDAYNMSLIEWVPDMSLSPHFSPGNQVICRMDYHFDEKVLVEALQTRPVNIITDKAIDINLLNHFKQNIVGITVEVRDESLLNFIKSLKLLNIKHKMYNKNLDDEKLSDLRAFYFDEGSIEKFIIKTKEDFIRDSSLYLNLSEEETNKIIFTERSNKNLFYRSNKFILSKGKIYTSKAAYEADLPANSFQENIQPAIENADFWQEYPHFYLFVE